MVPSSFKLKELKLDPFFFKKKNPHVNTGRYDRMRMSNDLFFFFLLTKRAKHRGARNPDLAVALKKARGMSLNEPSVDGLVQDIGTGQSSQATMDLASFGDPVDFERWIPG